MRRICAALVLLLDAGCDADLAENSCGIPTGQISLVATAVDNGMTRRAEVEFASENAAGVRGISLCDKDTLLINEQEAERVDRPERVIYSYTSMMTGMPTVGFELRRDGEDSVSFFITLPPAFEVITPEVNAEVSRSVDLVLEWAPPNPGEMMRIELAEEIGNGICLETLDPEHDYKGLAGVAIEDDGNWRIPAAVIDAGARDKCDASYRFTRTSGSPYPAALQAGGYLEGRVERLVAFLSVP